MTTISKHATSREALDHRTKAFHALCRERRLKVTHQRIEIYRELAGTSEHPSAEAIFRRIRAKLPSVSFDTVYRTLRLFEAQGIVTRVGPTDSRARFDARPGGHQHFICLECGTIADFCDPEMNRLLPPAVALELGSAQSLHIEVRGLCNKCAGNGRRARPQRRA